MGADQESARPSARKGTSGVSTDGVTANLVFFDRGAERSGEAVGKGQTGSALIGSLQISCNVFFDRRTFWALPLTYFDIVKSARSYLFPQSFKIHYFCSGPISVDPIYLQPRGAPDGCPDQSCSSKGLGRHGTDSFYKRSLCFGTIRAGHIHINMNNTNTSFSIQV